MKKHTQKLLSFILIITVTAALFLAACSEKKADLLTGNLKDVVRDVTSEFDFSGVEFLYKGDDMAEDVLYFTYGIDAYLQLLCRQHRHIYGNRLGLQLQFQLRGGNLIPVHIIHHRNRRGSKVHTASVDIHQQGNFLYTV